MICYTFLDEKIRALRRSRLRQRMLSPQVWKMFVLHIEFALFHALLFLRRLQESIRATPFDELHLSWRCGNFSFINFYIKMTWVLTPQKSTRFFLYLRPLAPFNVMYEKLSSPPGKRPICEVLFIIDIEWGQGVQVKSKTFRGSTGWGCPRFWCNVFLSKRMPCK